MKFLCLPFNCASKHTSAPTPPPPTKSHQNLTHSQSDTVSSASGMVADPQTPQEYSADERAKSTPPQGTQYPERPGDPSTHKCNDLAEWFQHVSTCYLFHVPTSQISLRLACRFQFTMLIKVSFSSRPLHRLLVNEKAPRWSELSTLLGKPRGATSTFGMRTESSGSTSLCPSGLRIFALRTFWWR